MARQTVLLALPYTIGAIAAPVLSYLVQPRVCLENLFLPYVLPTLVLLCLACGAAQTFIRWRPALQVALGVVFALSIQATLLVPCVSSLEEAPRITRLFVLSLWMTCFAAVALAATAVGLFRSGQLRVPLAVAAIGYAVAGASLVLSVIRQQLGAMGAIWIDPFVGLSEARMPVWLMLGAGVAVVGTAVAHVQRFASRPAGGPA